MTTGRDGALVWPNETVISWQAPPLKFGLGATREVGHDLRQLGVEKALVVTDSSLAELGLAETVRQTVEAEGIETEVFAGVHVEPTDRSVNEALAALQGNDFDGYVAVGGGSTIDTAKAINLLKTHPAELLHYITRPIGEGANPPGRHKPLVAVPTTAGTGSESTPVCIVDLLDLKVKSGISHNHLRPWLAVVDPLNTLTMPKEVTAASGYDVLAHALESYTALPYDQRPRYPSPAQRPAYIGANPISDMWCERALALIGRYLRRAYLNPNDLEARTGMAQAATFAGMGFGNAGVHIPHAVGYPVAGLVRDYTPQGYRTSEPLVPHGQSVIPTLPATLRFTYAAAPERQHHAAELLRGGSDSAAAAPEDVLAETVIELVRDTGGPLGLATFGYTDADIPALVEGALKQQRLLACCPRPVGGAELEQILRASMRWHV